MIKFKEPIIILGLPRSGTTIIQYILTKLKNSIIFNEFLLYLLDLNDYYYNLVKQKINSCLNIKEDFMNWSRNAAIYLDEDERKYLKNSLINLREKKKFIDLVYSKFGQIKLYGDKAPEYLFHIKYLLDNFEPKFILIYRDIRDCICSSILNYYKWKNKVNIKHHLWMQPNIKEAEKFYLNYLKALDSIKLIKKDKLFIIKCEEFVKKNKKLIRALSEYLNVSYIELNDICDKYLIEKYYTKWDKIIPLINKMLSIETLNYLKKWNYET